MNLPNLAHVIGQIVNYRSRCLDDEVEFRDTSSGVRNLGRYISEPRVPHVPAAAGLMRGYSSTSNMLTGHKQSKRLSPTK